MGTKLLDRFFLLHFSSGVIAYHWSISLPVWIILNIIFEIVENTVRGMLIINKYMHYWPGGKPKQDSVLNSATDVIAGVIGWYLAYLL